MTDPLNSTDVLPDQYKPAWDDLSSHHDFGVASFGLLQELAITVVLLANVATDEPLARNKAILRACLQRVALQGKSLLADIDSNDGYQQSQIFRQAAEVASNYLYLSHDSGAGERFDSFVNVSLAEEKNNLNAIAKQVRDRGDEFLPIEERMQRSMKRMASAADVKLEDVPRKNECGWPNSEERFKALGPVAYIAYRAGSSELHGGWSALLLRELDEVEGGFTMDGRGSPPDPRSLLALTYVIEMVATVHLSSECGEAERTVFSPRLATIRENYLRLSELHEDWYQTD